MTYRHLYWSIFHCLSDAYEVFYSPAWQDVTEEIISKAVFKEVILNEKPKVSGQIQQVDLKMPEPNGFSLWYFGVRALDGNQNPGKLSNAVQVWIVSATEVLPEDTNVTNGTDAELQTDAPTVCANEDFSKKYYKLIVFSSCVGVLALLILLNLLTWILCLRRQRKNQRKKTLEIGNYEVSQISRVDDKQRREAELLENPEETHYNRAYLSEQEREHSQEAENHTEQEPSYAMSMKQRKRTSLEQEQNEQELGFV